MKQDGKKQRHVADAETLVGDVLDLRAFCLVVDLRSFTGAAKAMGETKGTISRRITRLEQALGATLLQRSPRSVETTDDGAAYRMHVGHILEQLGDANLAVQRSHAAPSGHLRVTAPTDVAIGVLAAPIARFTLAYPDVRLEMVVTDKVLDLDAEHLDVALRASSRLPDTQLIAHKLFDVDLIVVASPAYLSQHGAPKRVEDLADERVAFLGSTRGRRKIAMRRLDALRAATEIEVRPVIGASDFSFIKEIAIAAASLAIVPSILVTEELANGRLVRVLAPYVAREAALYVIHRGERFVPPKVRAFVDHMIAEVGAPTGSRP